MKEGLLERIRAVGHWRVNIRPHPPLPERLTLQRCLEEVERARVSIRGWDYPHVSRRQDDHGGAERVGEYFENWCDWQSQVEFWRMYRSAQFLSYNALNEDLDGSYHNPPPGSFLDIRDAIYSVTEFCEFARRLHANGVHENGSELKISLSNTEGRQLWVGPGRIPFFDPMRTNASTILIERLVWPEDWTAGAIDIALSILLELFDHFGWNPAASQIKGDQEKFMRREF